jgi:hypothetical protein
MLNVVICIALLQSITNDLAAMRSLRDEIARHYYNDELVNSRDLDEAEKLCREGTKHLVKTLQHFQIPLSDAARYAAKVGLS